jgi:hypothetical protein
VLSARAALVFGRMFLLPVRENRLPDDARLAPSW